MLAVNALTIPAPEGLDAVIRLQRALARLVRRLREEMPSMDGVPDGLNAEQAILLAGLDDAPVTPGRLESTVYVGTNCNYNIKKLVELGLVTRGRAGDRRQTLITPTQDGLDVGAIIRRFLDHHVGAHWGDLPRHLPAETL